MYRTANLTYTNQSELILSDADGVQIDGKQAILLKRTSKSLGKLYRVVKKRKTWNQESLYRDLHQFVRFAD